MFSLPRRKINSQGSWEVVHKRLSILGSMKVIPSEQTVNNVIVEVRCGLRRIRTLTKHGGRFYLCNLKKGVYDLALTGITQTEPDSLAFDLTAFKAELEKPYYLVKSNKVDFELKIKNAVRMRNWICALHFEIKDQNISKICEYQKEVTHA